MKMIFMFLNNVTEDEKEKC